MRNLGSEVRPAVDLARLTNEWDLLEGREQRTLAEIRLAKGKLLVEARKAFPRSGPSARGWGELLAKWKIAERTARDYMALAGYVEQEVPANFAEIPTYADAGIVKRVEPKPDPAPPTEAEREAAYRREVVSSQPATMETRERVTHELVTFVSEARSSLRAITERNIHLTDVTTSPEDFMRAKQLLIDIVNLCLDELSNAGVLDGKEQRRQIVLLKGGK